MYGERLWRARGRRWQTGKHATKQAGLEGCGDIGRVWVMELGKRPQAHDAHVCVANLIDGSCGACAQPCTTRMPECTIGLFYLWGFQKEKRCALPTSAWDKATRGQRKEVTLGRSLSLLLQFLPHCNGKQKSITAWQRGKYFKDKILEPNSQPG